MDLAYLKEICVASYGQDDQQLPTAVELCSITLTADKSASLKVESGESDQVLTQVMNDTAIAEKKNMNLAGSKIELTALEAPTLLVSLAKKEFLATAAPPPDQSKMRLKETNAVDTAQMSLELPPHSDDNGSGSLYSKDEEPYDPPRLIRDAPINQDVKGEKGEQEKGDRKGKGRNATGNVDKDEVVAEALLNLKGGKGEKEKGGGKGKGSNATGNVTNDAVAAEAQLNLDVKGGKGEKEKGGGKGRAKGKGKKGGKDSAAKGNWEKGYGKGKAKGKGKKDSNGHGKGANSPEHQQVMPEAQFNVDVPGGKGAWEKGYGKGRAKGKGKKGSNGKGANNAGHKDFTDVKGGKGYRNKGHGKGNAKGKGKKGGNGHGKGANDAEHQHMMPEAQFNLDVSGGKGERVKGNGKGKAKGKGKKGGKDFQAKGDWDKGYGKGSPKGNGKKGGKDFQAKGGWDKGYGKANAKGKGKKGFEQNIYM